MPSQFFYKKLKKQQVGLAELLADQSAFRPIPDDWHVVLIDIENSTEAVQNGFHQDINLAATGGIIAVLNKLKELNKQLRVPYFFGGDGATFLVPNSILADILLVLSNYRLQIENIREFKLVVGSFPVTTAYAQNHQIKIAKIELTPYLTLPIVLGSGLKFAENTIKAAQRSKNEQSQKNEEVNLDGMECRWQKIEAPSHVTKVICLLAFAKDDHRQAEIYHTIIKRIDEIFGSYIKRQPISPPKLLLDLSLNRIKNEMYYRRGRFNLGYLIKNWLLTIFGKYYFKFFKDGKQYLEEITQLSHTLMIDGTINTILSGTQKEIDAFLLLMNTLEEQGHIHYGIHITHASIMSCYVEDMKTHHNHFIDGTEGGFTTAAIMLKQKMST